MIIVQTKPGTREEAREEFLEILRDHMTRYGPPPGGDVHVVMIFLDGGTENHIVTAREVFK